MSNLSATICFNKSQLIVIKILSVILFPFFSSNAYAVPKFKAVEGTFPYFTNGIMAAKAICMEEVGEIKKGKALWTFENKMIENDPIAKQYYYEYIKPDKEGYEEFVLYALDQVAMVYKNLSTEEKENYRKAIKGLSIEKRMKYLPENNCEKLLTKY